MNRYFGDVMQMVAVKKWLFSASACQRLSLALSGQETILDAVLSVRGCAGVAPFAFGIAFHNIAGLFFQMGLVRFNKRARFCIRWRAA